MTTRYSQSIPGFVLPFMLIAGAAALPAGAEGLKDPTRPPAALLASLKSTATGGAPQGTPSPTVGLQSIIAGPSGRVAMIDGKLVGVGGAINDAKVLEIRSDAVVIASDRGTETLSIFPGVQKHPVTPPADRGSSGSNKSKTAMIRRGSKQ